jgi:hypothetical protein
MAEYIPSPREWVRDQVELYERSGGTEGTTLRDTGLPVIIVTHTGNKRRNPQDPAVAREGRCQLCPRRVDGWAPEESGLGVQPAHQPSRRDPRSHRGAGDAGPRGPGRGRAGTPLGSRRRDLSAVRRLPGRDHTTHPGLRRGAGTLVGEISYASIELA